MARPAITAAVAVMGAMPVMPVARITPVDVADAGIPWVDVPDAGVPSVAVIAASAVTGAGVVIDPAVTLTIIAAWVSTDERSTPIISAAVMRSTLMACAHAKTDSQEPGLGGGRGHHSESADSCDQSKE